MSDHGLGTDGEVPRYQGLGTTRQELTGIKRGKEMTPDSNSRPLYQEGSGEQEGQAMPTLGRCLPRTRV
jgi:hypothetical protein